MSDPLMSLKEVAPRAYPETAVLDINQLADWLGVSKRQAERQHFPCFYLGTRTRRFLVKSVMEFLQRKEAA